jgi:hypothetical protein
LVPAFQHFFSLVKTGIEDYRDEFVNGPTETVDDDNENANFDYRNAHDGQRHNKHRYHAQDDTRDDDLSVESEFSIKEIIPKLRPPTTANKGRDNFLIASSTVSDFSGKFMITAQSYTWYFSFCSNASSNNFLSFCRIG